MNRYLSIVFLILPLIAKAGENLEFSHYSSSLRLAHENMTDLSAEFSGEITISGQLEVSFSRGEAYFFPNEPSLIMLPKVLNTLYPGAPTSIYIGSGAEILNMVLSKQSAIELLLAEQSSFESPAIITLRNLKTSIECDSRAFSATIVTISLKPENETLSTKPYSGC